MFIRNSKLETRKEFGCERDRRYTGQIMFETQNLKKEKYLGRASSFEQKK
jgi:hypothetical protein